jgi:hypothetical protein
VRKQKISEQQPSDRKTDHQTRFSDLSGYRVDGAIAALATLVIVHIALHRWVDMYDGPFAALAAVGVVTALLAGVMTIRFRAQRP